MLTKRVEYSTFNFITFVITFFPLSGHCLWQYTLFLTGTRVLETAVQQQCQGNELIVSGENGRERASVPQKKFGLLTSLIYDIDCILPTFSFNFFHAVVLYWEADEFLFESRCWYLLGKTLIRTGESSFCEIIFIIPEWQKPIRCNWNVIALQTVAPEKGNTSLKSSLK